MKKSMNQILWTTIPLALLWFAPIVSSHASHYREVHDFDTDVSPGWSSTQTESDPKGGSYLGGFGASQPMQLAIMDALPALNAITGSVDDSSRVVNLSFELVNIDPYSRYTVTANGEEIFSDRGLSILNRSWANESYGTPFEYIMETYNSCPPGFVCDTMFKIGRVPFNASFNASVETSFVLDGPNDPFDIVDLVIEFSESGRLYLRGGSSGSSIPFGRSIPGPWGFDNVVVDWGQPVPEPSTFVLTAMGILFFRQRFGRTVAVC